MNDEMLDKLTERLDDEPHSSHLGFTVFARIPAKDRNPLNKIFPLIAQETNLSESTIKQYAQAYKWNERASKIDAYLLKLDIQQRQKDNEALTLSFIEQNRKLKTDMMQNLGKSMEVLTNVLNYSVLANKEQVIKTIEDKDGNIVPVTTEVKLNFKLSDIPAMVKAIKTGIELVNEIPTDIINNKPVATVNINEVKSIQELEQIEAEINQELAQFDSSAIN